MPEPTAPAAESVTSRDVAKGVGTTVLARLGGALDIVTQPLYVWLFGLATFGLYAVLWAAVNLIENIADLGMTSALQRTVPKARDEAEAASALKTSLLYGVTPCFAIAAAASLAAPVVAHWFNAAPKDQAFLVEAIRVFAWALPLWAFVEIATSALRAKRVFGAEIRLRVFWEQVVRLGMVLALYAGGVTTMALLYGHLVSLTIIALLCIRLLGRYYDLRLVLAGGFHVETFQAGLAVLPSNAVARAFGDGPPIVLNALLPGSAGAVAGGLFAIARKVSSVVQMVRTAFVYVLAPLASAANQGRKEDVKAIYGFATRIQIAIGLPMGAVLISAGPAILKLFTKEAFVALPALAIMVVARIIEAASGAAAPIQQVTRGFKGQLVGSVLGLAVASALAFGLLPGGGLTGMAWAIAAGLIIASVTPMAQLWHKGRMHPFKWPFLRVLGIAAAAAAAGFALMSAALLLPRAIELAAIPLLLGAAIWCSARFALPRDDRIALGKTGRALRLAPR
jgi:O-antigen/teichoic acid export membrane protein